MIVDTFLVYQFIKKLITPFNQMSAYERGLIDQDGNFLKKRKYFSSDDKKVLGLFDIMIINLKKLIAKIPGGNTRIATIAAALMLLRSDPKKLREETIVNEMFELEEKLHATIRELELMEDASAPVNVTAGVAGLHPDSIGVPRKAAKKYLAKNIADVKRSTMKAAGTPTNPLALMKRGLLTSLGLTKNK